MMSGRCRGQPDPRPTGPPGPSRPAEGSPRTDEPRFKIKIMITTTATAPAAVEPPLIYITRAGLAYPMDYAPRMNDAWCFAAGRPTHGWSISSPKASQGVAAPPEGWVGSLPRPQPDTGALCGF
jgi:hypothetical protein